MALGDIILLKNKTPLGPFTRAQIQEGISRGEFSGHDLAHTPGLKDWLPLDEVLHHLDHDVVKASRTYAARTLPPVPGARIPMEISTPPVLPAAPVARETPPALPKKETFVSPPDLAAAVAARALDDGFVPAPLRARLLAWIIDWAILFVPVFVLFGFAYIVTGAQSAWEHMDAETLRQEHALLWRNLHDLLLFVAIGFGWLYGAGLESSRWQATVGKQWMRIVVTDEAGERMSFLRASGRHAAKYLSAVPCFAGFMAALFNPRRLAWHDRLAHTRVVSR
jgi:uncharacterized RDD family membrane protein YckC